MLYINIIFRSGEMKFQSKLNIVFILLGVLSLAATNAIAAKPEWAGKGKETAQESKGDQKDKYQGEKERMEQQQGKEKGELMREQNRLEKEGDDSKKKMKK